MPQISVETVPGKPLAVIVSGAHGSIVADEPRDDGGDELGFSPYELLLSALGACTAMTLELYSRRKGWPLEAVHVDLSFDRVHARDVEHCEQAGSRIELIRRRITLSGPLTAEQRERIMQIAAKCPVHRTLSGTPCIQDELVAAPALAY